MKKVIGVILLSAPLWAMIISIVQNYGIVHAAIFVGTLVFLFGSILGGIYLLASGDE